MVNNVLSAVAQQANLEPDSQLDVIHGNVNGYSVIASTSGTVVGNTNPNFLTYIFGINGGNPQLTAQEFAHLRGDLLYDFQVSNFQLAVLVQLDWNNNESINKALTALYTMTDYLASNNYQNADVYTGQPENTIPTVFDKQYLLVSQNSLNNLTSVSSNGEQMKGNQGLGYLGAFIGTLLGTAAIVLFTQIGVVAALSGLIMALASFWLFRKFGGKLNAVSIIVIILMMLGMTYVGERVSWAIAIAQQTPLSFLDGFLYTHELVEPSVFIMDLLMQYLFVAIGAISTIIRTIRFGRDTSENREVYVLSQYR